MSPRGSLTLFRVRGVPVRVHWTLLLVLPYLVFVLSTQLRAVVGLALDGAGAGEVLLPPYAWGAILAVALFASITLHELAHTLVALRFGGRVRSITLMLVGGVSQLARLPARPAHEAAMAAAGPLTSLALGGLFDAAFAASRGGPADLRMGLFYLAAMNLTLGAFNLLPAFPMDGGRLLRAALAARLGRARATAIAGLVGKGLALALAGLGLWSANLLLVLVSAFVYAGAQGELAEERARAALGGLRVVELLPRSRRAPLLAASATLDAAVPAMRALDRLELVVVDAAGAPRGILLATDLQGGSSSALAEETAGERAARLPRRHVAVPWDASANDALELAAEADAPYVVVVSSGADPQRPLEVIGLVAAGDIVRMVTLRLVDRSGDRRRPGAHGDPGGDARPAGGADAGGPAAASPEAAAAGRRGELAS